MGRAGGGTEVKVWDRGVVSVDVGGGVTGRDGGWCLWLDGDMVTCVHQEGLGLRVEGEYEDVKVELRGNVYDDVLRTWEGKWGEMEKKGGGEWGGRVVDA